MRIAGFQKNSFVDYPGNIAAVIFTSGCNLNCYYCHNRHLISHDAHQDLYDEKAILEFLASRRTFLDGVVISGGEPTLQSDLEKFLLSVKGLGYLVKLDTNGTRPHLLKTLTEKKLVDYVAMDIKAPLWRYAEICGVDVPIHHIQESINLLIRGKCDYEFRTTLIPDLKKEDVIDMAKMIRGAKRYVLQQYRMPPHYRNDIEDIRLYQQAHHPQVFSELISIIKPMVEACFSRGI